MSIDEKPNKAKRNDVNIDKIRKMGIVPINSIAVSVERIP